MGKLKKEDYMKLSKERLAELLVERDNEESNRTPFIGVGYSPDCFKPDGVCTNPYHDCINCPRQFEQGTSVTSTNISLINEGK